MKTKTKLLKIQSAIAIVLLPMLGFSSCQKEKDENISVALYGVRPAAFIDLGEVDAGNVEGFQITPEDDNSN
jgi:hypothetical protein